MKLENRGLLRDYEPSDGPSFKALLSSVQARSRHQAVSGLNAALHSVSAAAASLPAPGPAAAAAASSSVNVNASYRVAAAQRGGPRVAAVCVYLK